MDQAQIDRVQQGWIVRASLKHPGLCLQIGQGKKPIMWAVNIDPNPDRWAWSDVAGDALALPFESGSFDAIVSSHVLEHLQDLRAGIREMLRVMKMGGQMYHVIPDARYTPHRESHRHPFAHHHNEWHGPIHFGAAIADIPGLRVCKLENFPGFDWSFRLIGRKVS